MNKILQSAKFEQIFQEVYLENNSHHAYLLALKYFTNHNDAASLAICILSLSKIDKSDLPSANKTLVLIAKILKRSDTNCRTYLRPIALIIVNNKRFHKKNMSLLNLRDYLNLKFTDVLILILLFAKITTFEKIGIFIPSLNSLRLKIIRALSMTAETRGNENS